MVSLRDGKSYDPSAADAAAGASTGSGRASRRSSNAAATASARATTTRRSSRLHNSSPEEEDNVPFLSQETPVRGKRQRPQQLTALPEPSAAAAAAAAAGGGAASDDDDLLGAPDVSHNDQGFLQLQEAAAMDLPTDEPSPSAPSAKKPRIPAAARRTPTPFKAAAAASKLRRDTLSVSIAAAVMVLVAAMAMGALLPGFAPHRSQLRTSLLQTAAHTNDAYLQPFRARALDSYGSARTQLAAATAAAQQQAQSGLLTAQQQAQSMVLTAQQQAQSVLLTAQQQAQSLLLQAQQQAQSVLLQADARWPGVLPARLLQQLSAGPAASTHAAGGAWSVEILSSILPDGPQWAEYAADIADKLQAAPAARNHKAPALLLACGSADDCNEAAAALAVLPPKGEACTLTLDSDSLQGAPAPAAALQALLAPFLHRCPAGLVVLRGAQALPVAAVPALHNALSELGGFQHDGKVDGSRAAYALLLQLQPAQVAAAAAAPDSAAVDAAIKEGFFSALSAQLQDVPADAPEEAAHWGAVQRAVSTLHRRVEFAAPVRLGTSTEAALDDEAAA